MAKQEDEKRDRTSRFAWGVGDVRLGIPSWSAELQEATRAVLESQTVSAVVSNEIAFKNADGRFATMSEADLSNALLRITDRRTDAESVFDDVGALIEAGWVLD